MLVAKRVSLALLTLRLGVFIVMLMWTLDKFVNTKHASAVYEKFYWIGGLGPTAFYIIGAVELLIIIGFVLGYKKRFTYGAILIFHTISTLSSYKQYLDPFNNMLFWAAWPMLAACYALYLLRDMDTKWTISGARQNPDVE